MEFTYVIIFFILGLFMGSFYTVVGSRLPKGEKIINDRSHCDNCQHELTLLDMIPVLSYLFLRGRCKYCKEEINPLSTSMELFTGTLFALSYFRFGFSYELFIALGLVSMLIILSVSDLSYYIIPDEVLIFFSGYFLIITTLQFGVVPALISIRNGLILFGVMYLIMLIGNFLFKKESLGGGDIKLLFVFGLVIDPLLGLISIFIASVIALPIALILLKTKKQKLIPFGPFLLIAINFIYFTGITTKMILNFIELL